MTDLGDPPSSQPNLPGGQREHAVPRVPSAPRDAVDTAILDAAHSGDEARAAALILRHFGPALYGQARVLVGAASADDVLQDTVLALLAALREGRYHGGSSLRTYAMKTARYRAFQLHRSFWQRLLHHADDPGDDDDLAAPQSERAPPWGDDDPQELVARLLERLDERGRVVVTLRLEGSPFAAIARLLRISEANARKIHAHALARLRVELVEDPRGGTVLRPEDATAARSTTPAGRRGRGR